MVEFRRDIARALAVSPEPRLTVVRAGGLGDTLLVLPGIQCILAEYPRVRVTLIGSAWAERLLPLLSVELDVVRFDSAALTPLFAPRCPQDPSGCFAEADAVVLYTSDADDALTRNMQHLCGGPVVPWPVDPPDGVHAAAHFAHAFCAERPKSVDLPSPAVRADVVMQAWADQWLREVVPDQGDPIAVHPGSGGRRKCWPVEHLADVVKALNSPILLMEGPADTKPCDALAKLLAGRAPVALARGLSVPQAAALLAQCRLYVGNDSGLSHLAGALGVPSVVVFGPTDPRVWAPLGHAVCVVGPGQPGDAWPGSELVLAACRGLLA